MDPELEAFVALFPEAQLTDAVAARNNYAKSAAGIPEPADKVSASWWPYLGSMPASAYAAPARATDLRRALASDVLAADHATTRAATGLAAADYGPIVRTFGTEGIAG